MPTFTQLPDTQRPKTKTFNISLAQNAGTYDICTASGGDVFINDVVIKTTTAATGLTSITVQTNNTTPVSLLGSTVLANLTADRQEAALNTPLLLESGKKIQLTIVGNGTGTGNLKLVFSYLSVTAGADIS